MADNILVEHIEVEKEVNKTKRKPKKKSAFKKILNGEFLSQKEIIDNLPFASFVAFLMVLLISWGYYTESVGKQEAKLDDGYYVVNNKHCSLKELIYRYIEEILPKKRVGINEAIILKAFMRQPFVNKPIVQITAEELAQYRDKDMKELSLQLY